MNNLTVKLKFTKDGTLPHTSVTNRKYFMAKELLTQIEHISVYRQYYSITTLLHYSGKIFRSHYRTLYVYYSRSCGIYSNEIRLLLVFQFFAAYSCDLFK